MTPDLILDESVDFRIAKSLSEEGYQLFSIAQQNAGISDVEVLDISVKRNGILITEDADFGEWIFVHKATATGVIFLRYKSSDLLKIVSVLIKTVQKYERDLYGNFIVITPDKIRVRKI